MKQLIAILSLTIVTLTCPAQNMREVLQAMPDTLLPLLTRNNMLDFPDYLESSMKAEVNNRLGGTSEMTVLTDDFTEIKLSRSSTVQLKLLPYKNSKLILCIFSYFLNDSTADSELRFYDMKWNVYPNRQFFRELPSDNHTLVRASASALNTDLLMTVTHPFNIYPQGEEPERAPMENTTLQWNGKKYK